MAQGHGFDSPHFTGLDSRMQSRLRSLINASGGRIWLVSGYRSVEHQERLWNEALRKYGSAAAARKWVAPPGKSNHNRGMAVDVGGTDEGMQWARQNLARFGLWQPMAHEPWHFEVVNSAADFEPEAYTPAPIGGQPVGDPTDPGFQFARMLGMLDDDDGSLVDGPSVDVGTPGGELDVGEGQGIVIDSGASMKGFGFDNEADEREAQMDEVLDV